MSHPLVPLKQMATVLVSNVDKKSVDGEVPVQLCNYTDVYYNDEITADLAFMDATATPDQVSRFQLRRGDVLLTKDSETAEDIAVSARVAADLPGVLCGYHLAVVRPNPDRVLPEFLHYALRSQLARTQATAAATGVTRYGLRSQSLRGLFLPLPSIETQHAIVEWLDRELSADHQLLKRRAEQQELLSRYTFSLIREAFSGNDTSNRRAAGTPWLPDVPSHWQLPAVGHLFDVRLGKMLSPKTTAGPRQRPYLRNANISWDRLNLTDIATMHFDADEEQRYRVEPGDLLVCEGGAGGIAEAAVWDGSVEDCYYQKSLHRVRPKTDVPVRWLLHWLRLAKHLGAFTAGGNATAIPHLTGEQLRAYRIPVPPDVRARLVQLDGQLAEVHRLEGPMSDWRAKVQEHRDAAITAAVTGQIDLTGEAA